MMPRHGHRLGIGSALGLVASVAFAQDRAVPAAAEAPQRVEIDARPLSDTEQRRREPVAKAIYGREELDRHGDPSVADVLKRLPGVTLSGGNPRLRGLGAGYTLILVNGEPAPPGFSLDNLPPSQVERIEVTKGPTAEYPAVAGTINVVLREPPRQRQRELRLFGGYQVVRPTLGGYGSWGDRVGTVSYVLPLAVYQWRGEAGNGSARLAHAAGGAPQQVATAGTEGYWGSGYNASPRLTWKRGDADTLNLPLFAQRSIWHSAGRNDTQVLAGSPPPSVHDVYDNRGTWSMLRANPQWLHRGDDGARIELKGQWQATASRSLNHVDGADENGVPSIVRDTRQHNLERQLSLGAKGSRPWAESHTLVLGGDLEHRWRREVRSVIENGAEQLQGQDGQPFEARVARMALYAQDEWEIAPQWSTYLGLRSEAVQTRSAGVPGAPEQRSRTQVATPVWHLNHKLDPKGRDLVRFSVSRSVKAPEVSQLVGRYNLNALYPASQANTAVAPDRAGNPALQPERALGVDLALEKYLPGGGLFSVGLFHRRIDGLIRQNLALETVAEAAQQRWVLRPTNFAGAHSTGLEFELKGRADEWLPSAWTPSPALGLRASLSIYRSRVDGVPAPDARLDGQQPWSATAGFDHTLGPAVAGWPITWGAGWAVTPGYATQQSLLQRQWLAGTRSVDAYAMLVIGPALTLRGSVNNLTPRDSLQQGWVDEGGGLQARSDSWRQQRRSLNMQVLMKF